MNNILEINETNRVVDIKDIYGTLNYKVILDSHAVQSTVQITQTTNIVFQVIVRKITSDTSYLDLFTQDNITDKVAAIDLFDSKVKEYTLLVQSYYRDIVDINLYKDRIEYAKIDPDCCLNCAYCQNDVTRKYLECYNQDNYIFNDDYESRDITFLEVHPRVDNLGHCKNYKRRDSTQDKLIPSIIETIHGVVDGRVQANIENSVAAELERAIIGVNGGTASTDE